MEYTLFPCDMYAMNGKKDPNKQIEKNFLTYCLETTINVVY